MPLDKDKPYPKRARLLNKDSYKGERGYFITINTYNRKHYFDKKHIVDSVVKYLRISSVKYGFDIVAYCFMPDHLHIVLDGTRDTSDLTAFVKHFKQMSGYAFKSKFFQKLWATSFHDHVLRRQEAIEHVGRYTLQNPVVAGLAAHVLDYPYSGSFVYELKELIEHDPYM